MMIEMKVAGLTVDPSTNAPIVILRGIDGNIALPIWIGLLEASAIAAEFENMKFARPMTHDLLREVIARTDAKVAKVEVNDLRDNVYYATIHIEKDGMAHAIDSRPSDAIALALRTASPIFVDESVIEKSKNVDYAAKQVVVPREAKKDNNLQEVLEKLDPESFGKYKM